ncbi:hypothetical protein NLJ89_g9505 [Agrocybe chaxingu]|uniref:Arrestin-like N-terminal domain-containing protein n=1 Tax=Agrocybe chaxingu TaxID=84603 RepID=A0A9W8JTF7_9AGAR|nr:hypothetical protein NLJ89_g9505 [Agrocybe chaxingu]
MRPPRYSSVFQRDRRRHQDNRADEASGSGLQTHEYHLKSGSRAQPWATLKVLSKSSTKMSSSASALSSASGSGSRTSQKVAKFTSGDLVQGSLGLNLESPQNINSINLSLRGRIITSSYEGGSYTFLEQSIINWTRSNGDPRSLLPEPSSGSSPVARSNSNFSTFPTSNVRTKKYDGKLSGDYAWSFAFSFPSEVSMPGTSSSTCPAPQTFVEKGINGTVQYELVLRMTHGMLRSDSKLLVNIVYVPDITPPPSSVLRQLAYGENMGLPGPEVDPIGWHTLPPALVRGKLFNERNVKLQCTLSIANPQSPTTAPLSMCSPIPSVSPSASSAGITASRHLASVNARHLPGTELGLGLEVDVKLCVGVSDSNYELSGYTSHFGVNVSGQKQQPTLSTSPPNVHLLKKSPGRPLPLPLPKEVGQQDADQEEFTLAMDLPRSVGKRKSGPLATRQKLGSMFSETPTPLIC